jgi:hypothetical protein
MTLPLTAAPAAARTTFMNIPLRTELPSPDAGVAILGIPCGAPYAKDQVANDQSRAPGAIRAQSGQIGDGLDRWDFDLAGTYERAQAAARAGTFERNATR